MSTTALKLTALLFMLIDHIGQFIPGTPLILRWIGRLSAPLFVFCAMWGYWYTRNRRAHLIRLYLCGAGMGIGNALLNALFPAAPTQITNNIFGTILLSCVVLALIDRWREDRKAGCSALLLFLLSQTVSILICFWLVGRFFWRAEALACALLPNLLFNEGGPVWVLLGVLLYFTRENRQHLFAMYTVFCAALFFQSLYSAASVPGYALRGLFYLDFQWMMFFSLPFMLAYNGARGRGYKAFFYWFYPAHIYLLFFLSILLTR